MDNALSRTPYLVKAGDNKYNLTSCPFCKNQPIAVVNDDNENILAYQFRNRLSAIEYTISGLCQACQDSMFGKD
jgi:hypothetical protein